MAAGAVGAVLAGSDCGGTVQSALQDAAADAPSMHDASEASAPVDASEASSIPVDASGGSDASGDVTEDWGGGIALYGAPPPPPDDSGSGPGEPDSGRGG
jgi:hypothetical protein